MKRVLLVKLSSMGDIIHTLPAVTDACQADPGLQLHWLVEESFAEIPRWHSGVHQVHTVALRRWKKGLLRGENWRQANRAVRNLRRLHFDRAVDAQGLVKSALTARLGCGAPLHGPHRSWAREPLSSLFYSSRHRVDPKDHVVQHMRALMAASLDYALPTRAADYGLQRERLPAPPAELAEPPYMLLLHGAGWTSKAWPEAYWLELATQLWQQYQIPLYLPWGNLAEKQRAERIVAGLSAGAHLLPRLKLGEMASLIADAHMVVGLDSGFGHLAAALGRPHITLFGATNPHYSGVSSSSGTLLPAEYSCAPCMKRVCPLPVTSLDEAQIHPPCFKSLSPELVLDAIKQQLKPEL
uniref:Lipopolysaccharide heptosyltransferase 1 n=1 Tax=Magnetococcus massalia (strain MO-1) TaxID=451514 RepID=A0A1S7LDQ9_MAGMO|nr:GT9 : ADP-heptose:LPS heptosyl transferase I [Candidatus Magnetococcus massalia]